MNDLYFFFKISRKKPCSHLPAARKAVFCLFFRPKGLAFRPFVFLLPGPFRHNLLPEASVSGTKAHPVSQLYRAAAKPGDIIILSPASASFDLYPNFEVRGREFKKIVNALK